MDGKKLRSNGRATLNGFIVRVARSLARSIIRSLATVVRSFVRSRVRLSSSSLLQHARALYEAGPKTHEAGRAHRGDRVPTKLGRPNKRRRQRPRRRRQPVMKLAAVGSFRNRKQRAAAAGWLEEWEFLSPRSELCQRRPTKPTERRVGARGEIQFVVLHLDCERRRRKLLGSSLWLYASITSKLVGCRCCRLCVFWQRAHAEEWARSQRAFKSVRPSVCLFAGGGGGGNSEGAELN